MLHFNCVYSMYCGPLEGKLPQKRCQLEVLREVLLWIYFKNRPEEVYESNRKQLNDTRFTQVTEYFESSWHLIQHEWFACFITSFNFNTHINNRLESTNQKIKSVCSAFSDLQTFFRDFQAILSCLRIKRDHKVLNCTSKVSVLGVDSSVEA